MPVWCWAWMPVSISSVGLMNLMRAICPSSGLNIVDVSWLDAILDDKAALNRRCCLHHWCGVNGFSCFASHCGKAGHKKRKANRNQRYRFHHNLPKSNRYHHYSKSLLREFFGTLSLCNQFHIRNNLLQTVTNDTPSLWQNSRKERGNDKAITGC